MKHLGGGVVLFEKIIDIPSHIIPELSEMVDIAFNTMYDFVYDKNGEVEYGVNLSGHTVYKEDLHSDPIRITGPGIVINPEFFGLAIKRFIKNYSNIFHFSLMLFHVFGGK